MFDIFCHRITFVFQDTQVEINDLLDFLVPGEAPHNMTATEVAKRMADAKAADPTFSVKKQGLVDRLTALLDERRNQRERDRIEEEREKKQDREDVAKVKASHKKDRPI